VYDYVAGKVDWFAHNLPAERESAVVTAADFLRTDVVTCGLQEPTGEVSARIDESPYGFAVVVGDQQVVLGRLPRSALNAARDARVEEVMESGPSTVRPDKPGDDLVERLRTRDLRFAMVTTPEGRLLGIVRRADVEDGLR
jgi:CBS-domain-containing membrane protein